MHTVGTREETYHVGDKITYNGKHYTCQKNNVSSSPDEDPKRWQLVE